MKKVFALILAVALVACMFVGCGAAEEESTTLIMATNAEFPPYEYFEDEAIVGIDAEIAQAICDKLGYNLQIDNMEFGAIISAVTSGKADFGMAGMTVTEERLESVNFSDVYAVGVQVVIVKEGSDIASLDDLAGKKIGVQENTTGDIYSTDEFGDEFIERYPKGSDAVLALTQGKIDAVIIDNEPAKNFVASNEGLVILDTEYAVEDYAIAVSKDNEDLLKDINAALAELTADGTLDKIVAKYIPAE